MAETRTLTKRLTKRNSRLALGQHEFHAGGGMMLKMWQDWVPGRVEYDLFGEPLFFPLGEDKPIRDLPEREAKIWE